VVQNYICKLSVALAVFCYQRVIPHIVNSEDGTYINTRNILLWFHFISLQKNLSRVWTMKSIKTSHRCVIEMPNEE
jgi:hypothetical protein